MKGKRFAVEQIVAILKQAELGMAASDIVRQLDMSKRAFYRWKKQYTGLESNEDVVATLNRRSPAPSSVNKWP